MCCHACRSVHCGKIWLPVPHKYYHLLHGTNQGPRGHLTHLEQNLIIRDHELKVLRIDRFDVDSQ